MNGIPGDIAELAPAYHQRCRQIFNTDFGQSILPTHALQRYGRVPRINKESEDLRLSAHNGDVSVVRVKISP